MIKKLKKIYSKFSAWMSWNPPGALTTKGWRLFNQEYKEKAPIRYWFTHTFRYKIIYPIKRKYSAVCDWIRYRTYNRYHVVDTGLKPGYYEFDSILLHSNFNLFKDFIECEKAWSAWCWADPEIKLEQWYEKLPFYWRIVKFRKPEHGLRALEWEITLDSPSLPVTQQSPAQAESAREQLALYNWWTKDRPSRKEEDIPTYSNQGLDFMAPLDDDFDHTAEDYVKSSEIRSRNEALRQAWEKEDEEMLIRLIKIRHHLWT